MSYGVYGGFHGGDPRKFTPDSECCSAEEIAAWEACCDAWNKGHRPGVDGHISVYDAEGRLVLHVARNPFGIGVTMVDGDDPDEDDGGGSDDGDPEDDGPDDPAEMGDDEAEVGDELTTVPAAWLSANLDATADAPEPRP